MRINKGEVEWREVKIRIRDSNEDRLIDGGVTLINLIRRLPAPSLVRSCNLQWCVRSINLAHPSEELGLTSSCRGDVAVVRANGLAGVFPLKEDLAAGECQRFGLVARDGWRAVVACCRVVDAGFSLGKVRYGGIGDAGANDFGLGGVIRRNPGKLLVLSRSLCLGLLTC